LVENLVLATKTRFGWLAHYNDDLGPSPFEGFDLGGSGMTGYSWYGRDVIALRGYKDGSLTPIIEGSKSGNVFTKYSLELRYPAVLKPQATIYFLGFLEAGNCWYDFKEFNPYLVKRSVGVGLRAFLPMFGLLGIDWGYGVDEVYRNGKPQHGSQFHFVIGQNF
jgi:outer membrane protein insertion porin family